MTLLSLVRHGETDWNAARRIQGTTDIPLNDVGRAQALVTARHLADSGLHGIVTSPLSRARETAVIIAAELGLPEPEVLDDIMERNYGAAEGLDYRTLDRDFPEGVPVPGRESREQVASRSLRALVALAERRPGQRLAVTTHGGVIRSVVNAVVPDRSRFAGVRIANGSVHSFRYAEGTLTLQQFDEQNALVAD